MTTLTWHPIDSATIPRDKRIMLWDGDNIHLGYVHDLYDRVYIGNEEPDYIDDFTHWAECPAGPNGEMP